MGKKGIWFDWFKLNWLVDICGNLELVTWIQYLSDISCSFNIIKITTTLIHGRHLQFFFFFYKNEHSWAYFRLKASVSYQILTSSGISPIMFFWSEEFKTKIKGFLPSYNTSWINLRLKNKNLTWKIHSNNRKDDILYLQPIKFIFSIHACRYSSKLGSTRSRWLKYTGYLLMHILWIEDHQLRSAK